MNIRTKVATTIIAMVCSLSVSASGIAAILLDFPIQVASTTALAVGEIQGDLYGERYGANDQDLIMQHLFKNGEGPQEIEMNTYCEDVTFSKGSSEIVYVMKFILSSDAENGTLISLSNGSLTNSVTYEDTYQIAYGQAEPDWANASEMEPQKTYVVSQENPYIWLRAELSINKDAVARIETSATWTFSFYFEGVGESN